MTFFTSGPNCTTLLWYLIRKLKMLKSTFSELETWIFVSKKVFDHHEDFWICFPHFFLKKGNFSILSCQMRYKRGAMINFNEWLISIVDPDLLPWYFTWPWTTSINYLATMISFHNFILLPLNKFNTFNIIIILLFILYDIMETIIYLFYPNLT